MDLSSPGGLSVNDGIDPDDFSMQYITVDQIIRMISSYGLGALMAKFDVEAAYRNIAVHPSDRYLLGMRWRKHYYVDLALPFGLPPLHIFSIPWRTWWSGFSYMHTIFQRCYII